jgi:hypothetical protein
MNEKSAPGSSRRSAAAAANAEAPGAGAAPAAAARGGPKLAARPGLPPRRPPDRLSQPSTLSLKKSVRTIRFEVMPPWE